MKKGMTCLMNGTIKRDRLNDIIETMGTSLSFLTVGVLEAKVDEYCFREKKIKNLYDFLQAEKKRSVVNENLQDLIVEAKETRTYIYNAMKLIPLSHFLRLAEISRGNSTNSPEIKKVLQGGFLIICVWTDRVLQEHYRMSEAKRTEFFCYLVDWIDSYYRGYLDNAGI